ncbi:Hypothetical predicted protein [Olea europaea subsp. europaea]|uniref:Uncharacterized protein n=1 Tax=Olea europaea subsp. europaea TaxID=158383 RepID=A0A8S0U5I9_OLEEU|nr:Hypothetical predicted protein [Olea europaea subsp. europaea]
MRFTVTKGTEWSQRKNKEEIDGKWVENGDLQSNVVGEKGWLLNFASGFPGYHTAFTVSASDLTIPTQLSQSASREIAGIGHMWVDLQ